MARIRAGIGPVWYGALRMELSAAVVMFLGIASVSSLGGVV